MPSLTLGSKLASSLKVKPGGSVGAIVTTTVASRVFVEVPGLFLIHCQLAFSKSLATSVFLICKMEINISSYLLHGAVMRECPVLCKVIHSVDTVESDKLSSLPEWSFQLGRQY